MIKTAILVDGGFYRKRAAALWGQKSAQERAEELFRYCLLHLYERGDEKRHHLYRILYYDCPPIQKQVFHPWLQKAVDFGKSETYKWANNFFDELKRKRKVALRFGTLADEQAHFSLSETVIKQLFNGSRVFSDITDKDFIFNIRQKGVDMKIGIDITAITYKKLADQIVLIAGDSDFVPVAKLARREGLDFILDPLRAKIHLSLSEHIDGLRSF